MKYINFALIPFKGVNVVNDAEEITLKHNEKLLGGWVYALSNESFPDLLKIGLTTISPEDRAKQLSSSGVPTPFKVEWSVQVKDAPKVEKQIHTHFADFRVNPSREFFRVTLSELINYVSEEVDEYISSGVDLYLQFHAVHLDHPKKVKRESVMLSSELLDMIDCSVFTKSKIAFIESCVELIVNNFRGSLLFKNGQVTVAPEPEYSGHSDMLKPHEKPVQIKVKKGGFSL